MAEFRGMKVKLNSPSAIRKGEPGYGRKKSKVFVMSNGKVKKVMFGEVMAAKKGLYHNINKRKKAGTSRSKKKSTISPKAYANMKAGFPKKKKKK